MRKESIFTGAATAIVTPMNAQGIDYEAFERMLNWQVAQGIDALVICGTTGEGSTLSDEEHREVLQFAINVEYVFLHQINQPNSEAHIMLPEHIL